MANAIANDISYYDQVLFALVAAHIQLSPAEIHGMVCGLLAGDHHVTVNEVMTVLFSEMTEIEKLPKKFKQTMEEMFAITAHELVDPDLGFQLLLPDDDEALAERVKALTEWSDAFILGLHQSGIAFEDIKNEEVQDVLLQLADFAQLDYSALTGTEEEEKFYTEIVEYLRMAVLMLYAEFAGGHGCCADHDHSTIH